MNHKEYSATIAALETIDRTGRAPRLSGAIGRYFRTYLRHRLDVSHLATTMGLIPGRDGVLRGDQDSVVTLRFLDDVTAWDQTTMEFGTLHHVPALCDELLSPITLRLWSNSGAGAEGLSIVDFDRVRTQGIELKGPYFWRPPNVLLPGRASIQVVDIASRPQWRGADYLRYVGEDFGVDPHPLTYLPMKLERGTRIFASLRVVCGFAKDDSILVPFATQRGYVSVKVRYLVDLAPVERTFHANRQPAIWLVAREPDSETALVLNGVESSGDEFLEHSLKWASLLKTLDPDSLLSQTSSIREHVQRNLAELGLSASEKASETTAEVSGAVPFALRIASLLRFPGRRAPIEVLRGEG